MKNVLPRERANALRVLAMDAVQKANSGHPGMPMGMADIAEVLWHGYLKHDPASPTWPNRDRFVLSNGHGSMLLYGLLHLTGYDLPLEELKNFRQLGSKTAGHPEYRLTPGVETTTGPLGQGIANAVGMALAEKILSAEFNRPGHSIIDHYTYVFMGDGCLMEGISHEACSLAGTWGLSKLIVFWDDNGISIDGPVQDWFTDDTPARFESYGWRVIRNVEGHSSNAITEAIEKARQPSQQPTLICCKTQIGYGSPNRAGSAESHGSPLGPEEILNTRKALGWSSGPFEIPAEIRASWDASARGQANSHRWKEQFLAYQSAYPELAAELERRLAGELPESWEINTTQWLSETLQQRESVASRKASQQVLSKLCPALPELIGGSADLTGSNLTAVKGSKAFAAAKPAGNYIYYGVREFGMLAIMNGLALYGGFIPYGGTFLVFSDYARNAIRMAALMKLRVIYVFTHDSIGLGEDGPTHQPVEHLESLRLIPNLVVIRPCDTVETCLAWQMAIERKDGPTALILSRQNLPFQQRVPEQLGNIPKGGYLLRQHANARLTLLATGSEVENCMSAAEELSKKGVEANVVSMPSVELFEAQSKAYRHSVLLKNLPILAVEAGLTRGWQRWVGHSGAVLGIDSFGESAPAGHLFEHFHLTTKDIVQKALTLIEGEV